ncbi:MAG: TIM-barrel domain-containing protein, partial [Planctomycetota bacterium]
TVIAATSTYQVVMAKDATSLDGIVVRDGAGKRIYGFHRNHLTKDQYLPTPSALPAAWAMPDRPRMVPPAWGAAPAPEGNSEFAATSGWDLDNQADDLYLFIPGDGGYEQFRSDFLALTGPVALPPLYAFGFWYSRWHPYSSEMTLDRVDEFRRHGFPLDVFVLDTDWRMGKSHGYEINTELHPDMTKLHEQLHAKGVRTMFNDHPEPVSDQALSPEEVAYRYKGLTTVLETGGDAWWFDRNWGVSLGTPAKGLLHDAWGMRHFHDITKQYRPEQRPLIMSNVEGIKGGNNAFPSHPASHRYPIWWTGDTAAEWRFLEKGIVNAVESGLTRLMPYIGEDLGGFHDIPAPDLYVRYMQYGALSPTTRIHCTNGQSRLPWLFGEEAEGIIRDYIHMRYRLLPTIYSAARKAYESGMPLLRRCDLEWPEHQEAASNLQYLLGDDILVAPQYHNDEYPAPIDGTWTDGPITMAYYNNKELSGEPVATETTDKLDFMWWGMAPLMPKGTPDMTKAERKKLKSVVNRDNFSIRCTMTLKPLAEAGTYRFAPHIGRDGFRLYVDGKLIHDQWYPNEGEEAYRVDTELPAGKPIEVVYEYRHHERVAKCILGVSKYSGPLPLKRSLWLPPGTWIDAWSGERHQGPATIIATSPLAHTPMYLRAGGVVIQTSLREHSGTMPWDTVVVDAFPHDGSELSRTLYEDDGISPAYEQGAVSTTAVGVVHSNGRSTVAIAPVAGDFIAADHQRDWVVRVHLAAGATPQQVTVNGAAVALGAQVASEGASAVVIAPAAAATMPFAGVGSAPGPQAGPVVEVHLPQQSVATGLTITIE